MKYFVIAIIAGMGWRIGDLMFSYFYDLILNKRKTSSKKDYKSYYR